MENIKPISILFILPVQGGSGGVHSVVQECLELYCYGILAQIAIPQSNFDSFLENYPETPELTDVVICYTTFEKLFEIANRFSVVCATIYYSVKILEKIVKQNPCILPAYYVQDYETLFFPKDLPEAEEARCSYTHIPDTVLFAKTQWLCDTVQKNHQVTVYKVEPSIDHQIYYPDLRLNHHNISIAIMVRFSTKRRAPMRTLRIAKILSDIFAEKVEFTIFGSSREDVEGSGFPLPLQTVILGQITRSEVANLLRNSDIFLDLSDYQAFGRTALEAMASGCIAVVPKHGGTMEFAIPYINSIVVDTRSERECVQKIIELIRADPEFRFQLRLNGIETAARYTRKRAAFSIYNLLNYKYYQKFNKRI